MADQLAGPVVALAEQNAIELDLRNVCRRKDCDQMSDVASGKIAAITTDDVLAQLGEAGLCKRAMVIEIKDVPEPQPVHNRKRRGKNATRAQKPQKKRLASNE